jgi:hypothetical protein
MAVDISELTRRTIIDMALRRQRRGAGSSDAFLAQRTTHMHWLDLTPVLAPIRWAVVGAAATRLYMPERVTLDLDIAIAAWDAAAVARRLEAGGFVKLNDLSIGGATWRAPDGQTVDVIELDEPWHDTALDGAQANRDAQGLPILPLPYLVLMKFKAGRTRDLGDITQMLGLADEAMLERVRTTFQRHSPGDIEDLESLITLGKLEMGRE